MKSKFPNFVSLKSYSGVLILTSESSKTLRNPGAEEVNRTPDLLITNQLLYQLSYFGISLIV